MSIQIRKLFTHPSRAHNVRQQVHRRKPEHNEFSLSKHLKFNNSLIAFLFIYLLASRCRIEDRTGVVSVNGKLCRQHGTLMNHRRRKKDSRPLCELHWSKGTLDPSIPIVSMAARSPRFLPGKQIEQQCFCLLYIFMCLLEWEKGNRLKLFVQWINKTPSESAVLITSVKLSERLFRSRFHAGAIDLRATSKHVLNNNYRTAFVCCENKRGIGKFSSNTHSFVSFDLNEPQLSFRSDNFPCREMNFREYRFVPRIPSTISQKTNHQYHAIKQLKFLLNIILSNRRN